MQEDKEGIFDALDTWQDCVDMATFVLDELKVNTDRTREAALKGYSNATELADYLVAKGVPFRDSHHIVGETVVYAIEKGKALEDLTIPEFRQFSDVVGDDVYDILSLQSCLDKRCAKGWGFTTSSGRSDCRSKSEISLISVNKRAVKNVVFFDRSFVFMA